MIVFGIKAPFCGINADQELIAKFVREHADRFIGWCSVDPNDPDCVDQLVHYVKTRPRGLKCSPIYQNWNPPGPEAPAAVQEGRAARHPGERPPGTTFVRAGPLKYANPVLLEDIAIACPEPAARHRAHGPPVGRRSASS